MLHKSRRLLAVPYVPLPLVELLLLEFLSANKGVEELDRLFPLIFDLVITKPSVIIREMKFERILKNWGPVFFWAVLIFVGSSLPSPEISKVGWVSFVISSFAHFVEFSVLSFLIFRALSLAERSPEKVLKQVTRTLDTLRFGVKLFFLRLFWEIFVPKKMLAAILITVVYAATDELHQYFVPGRNCSFWDFFFDSFGALSGVLFYHIVRVEK